MPSIKIKNWKLALLSLLLIYLFTHLGFWQLARAKQKKLLLQSFAERTEQAPLAATALKKLTDFRFYQARLQGHFDNTHTFLLDNKIVNGQIGYEVYTPFYAEQFTNVILVDRGFIAMNANRQILPLIPPILGMTTITGMLNLPPTYFAWGKMTDSTQLNWPLRIEFIHLQEIAQLLAQPLFSYTLSLSPHDPRAFPIQWQIVTMGPEKHIGYAIQWFALALTLLILSVALNWKR
ncbi:MAG: SURF1 family protein [Gammaproteobacteria bacterium]|nr:SURF1 family protein [Gammaproteobacteria bacterium]